MVNPGQTDGNPGRRELSQEWEDPEVQERTAREISTQADQRKLRRSEPSQE